MEGESLRTYVHRFNKEALQIDRPKEDFTLIAFMARLRKGDFLYDLCKDPLETLSELMYEAQKHMNVEDAIESRDPLQRDEKILTTVNKNRPSRKFLSSLKHQSIKGRPPPPENSIASHL
jgi:hypothetical protein